MPLNRTISWLKYFLLALPLVCLAAWLTAGGVSGSFGPDASGGALPAKSAPSAIISRSSQAGSMAPEPSPIDGEPGSVAPGSPAPPAASPVPFPGYRPPPPSPEPFLVGFPPPDQEYTADHLFERVDGAADALIAAGCDRLLYWRIAEPRSEMELLIFQGPEGAAKVLSRDAGPGRDPGPGEEASVTDQSVYFRRGRFYVRILGDPSAGASRKKLLDLAARADRGLPAGKGDGAGIRAPAGVRPAGQGQWPPQARRAIQARRALQDHSPIQSDRPTQGGKPTQAVRPTQTQGSNQGQWLAQARGPAQADSPIQSDKPAPSVKGTQSSEPAQSARPAKAGGPGRDVRPSPGCRQ